MTIVGTAELDVRAVGSHFDADLQKNAMPGMRKLGDESERAAGRGRKAFGVMFQAIRESSAGALAPVTELLGHVQGVADELHSKSIGLKVAAAGAAGLGVGAGLQTFSSKEVASQQQLSAAIDQTGHTYEEYAGQIEGTVKKGEKFGYLAYQTMDVLNRLTIATNDPTKALKDYQVALDMAAARHMPVTRAAQMLGYIYGGNTRAARMFGVTLVDQNKVIAEAKKKTDAHTKAVEAQKKAAQNLADVEARLGAVHGKAGASADQVASARARVASATSAAQVAEFKHGAQSPQYASARAKLVAAEEHLNTVLADTGTAAKLTVSQEIELRKAHQALDDANKKVTSTTKDMTDAQKKAKDATNNADDAINQIAKRLSGQAAASADTWSGHLRAAGAVLEDHISQIGTKYGGAITAFSTGVMALGTVIEISRGGFGRLKASTDAAKTSTQELGVAEETTATQTEVSTSRAAAASERNMGRIAGAVAGVAMAIGATMAVGSATAGAGAKGAAATSLTGALSGAIVGLSVGGPFGAAVGGAVGLLGGLATHFHDAASKADGMTTAVKNLAGELSTAFTADKYTLGAQSKTAIEGFLAQKGNAGGTQDLAKAGVSIDDIINSILHPHTKQGDQALGKLRFAHDQGTLTGKQYQAALDVLAAVGKAFSDMLAVTTAIGQMAGAQGAGALPKSNAPVTGHRAGGGRVNVGALYQVNESGVELFRPDVPGVVIPHGRGAATGSGGDLIAEIRALRMSVDALRGLAGSQIRATEDVPHGIGRELVRAGDHRWGSPETRHG